MTPTRHLIRLRGPWRWTAVWQQAASWKRSEATEPLGSPAELTCEMPFDWTAAWGRSFRGSIRGIRRFGRPTGLSQVDRVELVIEPADVAGRVLLNDRYLAPLPPRGSSQRIDVLDDLLQRNELVLEVDVGEDDACLPRRLDFQVRLEIIPQES